MIIERFAELLKGRKIYEELAVEVAELRELRFASLMVQTLNIILLTSPELFELREDIQRVKIVFLFFMTGETCHKVQKGREIHVF